MDKDVMIRVEGLGKKYVLGQGGQPGRYTALRDVLTEAVKAPFRRWRRGAAGPTPKQDNTEFWALRDVNLEVRRGEVVGIIGRNGAGKSTLLKVLSRITEPTTGRITLKGRVASLLEVGTGFHPELTGRENVFLNGAILGMTRVEIRRKFDDIVAFAEVEQFLDTPVKRYSSGMYVRLAFAVAAYLEPDILIVDEVLAVGDAQFQKKCLGKMHDFAEQGGRTILFVSHNMAAITSLCKTAVYLDKGSVLSQGPVEPITTLYNQTGNDELTAEVTNYPLSPEVVVTKLKAEPNPLQSGSTVCLQLTLSAGITRETITGLCLLIYTLEGLRVSIIDFRSLQPTFILEPGDSLQLEARLNRVDLVEADYSVGLYYLSGTTSADLPDLMRLSVLPRAGSLGVVPYAARYRGVVELAWQPSLLELSKKL